MKRSSPLFMRHAAVAVLALLSTACARKHQSPLVLGEPVGFTYGQAVFEIEDRGTYVYCNVKGRCTVGNAVAGVRQIFRYTKANDRRRVLLDAWTVDLSSMTPGELILGALSLLPSWDFGLKIAAHVPADVLPALSSGSAFPSSLQVLKVRRYDTLAEAEAWLLKDD